MVHVSMEMTPPGSDEYYLSYVTQNNLDFSLFKTKTHLVIHSLIQTFCVVTSVLPLSPYVTILAQCVGKLAQKNF